MVARGRKLCVLLLVCFVSDFVVIYRHVLVCGRQLLFLVLCINISCLFSLSLCGSVSG